MRPVKYELKTLGKTNNGVSDKEWQDHTRKCLIKIGNRINVCVEFYKDPIQNKNWKTNFWRFVAKFTDLDAKRLYKLYKRALADTSSDAAPSKVL